MRDFPVSPPSHGRSMNDPTQHITMLLHRLAAGDRSANDELWPIVYEELRLMAQAQFRGPQNSARTLRPTALVHEAYIKLFGIQTPAFNDRKHFLAVAAKAMRAVLVDRARARAAMKRGSNPTQIPLGDIVVAHEDRDFDVVALHDALNELAKVSPRAAHVVELRYFGGMEVGAIAEFLGASLQEIEKEFRLARAWLKREIEGPDRTMTA